MNMNNITYKRKSRKSMLGTRHLKPPSVEPISEGTYSEEKESTPELPPPPPVPEPIEEDELVIKTVRKNIVCSLFPNDSFEENETMLANSSINETVLATTLLMSVRKKDEPVCNKQKDDPALEKQKNDILIVKEEDDTLQQVLHTITSLLKENSIAIENNKQEREILNEMKKNLLEKIQK